MAEFSKGPWTVQKSGKTVHAVGVAIYQSSGPGAQSMAVQKLHDETLRANARLIAAAPELYEACTAMVKAWDEGIVELDKAVKKAVLAINKANGK